MSRLVVADCSVTPAWFIPDENSDNAERLLSDVLKGNSSLVVPDLWWYETLNVLRTSVLRERLDGIAVRKALFFLREIPLRAVPAEELERHAILALALEHNLTAYDATYLALALSIGADLVTADKDILRLKRKFAFVCEPSKY